MKTITRISIFIFFIWSSLTLQGQDKFTIRGNVSDSLGSALPGATVVLLEKADSVMTQFGITDPEGTFSLPKTSRGEYLLQITYVGYQPHYQEILLNKDIEAGRIQLHPLSTDLQEILVKGEYVPMVMKDDTVEYNADAFQVRPNAPVEDLLKRLPGLEVDRAGNIKAQGEDVQKVLVDGKEFFGDDPKIATKNLPANAVDKVQVFDKKSEMAEFSGVEDGQREKTINLTLKEDKKQGYFGNVTAGYGTDQRYKGKANINRFSQKMQLSAIGLANNINEQGFSINDYINLMGGLQNMMSGAGTGTFKISIDDGSLPLNMGGNNGIANTYAGGLNFNYEPDDKTELNTSYFFSRFENNLQRSLFRENLLGANNFSTREESTEFTQNTTHQVNTTLRHEIDSTQRLIFRGSLGFNQALFDNLENSQNLNNENVVENIGFNDYHSEGEKLNWNTNLTYLKRLGKPGRVFTSKLSLGIGDDRRTASLFSENVFLPDDPNFGFADTTFQQQDYLDDQLNYGAELAYTEPLGGGKYLEANYEHQNFSNELQKDFFDIQENGQQFNPDLSTHYTRDYIYDRGGLSFRLNRKDWLLSLGTRLQHSRLKGELLDENIPIENTFTNLLPNLRFRYDFATTRNLNVNYRTYVREPSLEQLQPVVDNSNPLSTYVGNPDLQPEYAHDVNLRFMSFSQFSNTSFFGNLQATYTRNRITNAQEIDSLLRRHIMPVNVDQDWTLGSHFSLGAPLKLIQSKINFNADANYNRGMLFVNAIENSVDRWTGSFGLSLENRKKKIMDAMAGVDFGFNSTRYSDAGGLDQDFFDQTWYVDLILNLGQTWTIESSVEYTRFSGAAFENTDLGPLWEASISKLLWDNRLQLKLSAFDLLNRNQGINRSSQLNYLQEERINVLNRYAMLHLSYSLSGFGKDQGGIQITTRR